MNSVTLYGNLARDPELRYTPSGQATASTAIAVSQRWKDKDGQKKEKTTFINLVFWGKSAELVQQYFAKGAPILVQGRLDIRSYEKDGLKRSYTSVVVKDFFFTSGRKNGTGGAQQAQGTPQQTYQGARVVSAPTSAPAAVNEELAGGVPGVPDSDIPW